MYINGGGESFFWLVNYIRLGDCLYLVVKEVK